MLSIELFNNNKGDISKSVSGSVVICLLWSLMGYLLPYFINEFTLNYFVFHDVERKIKKNPSLLEVHKTEKKYLQSNEWIRLIFKCMYVVWPMTILVLVLVLVLVGLRSRSLIVFSPGASDLFLLLFGSFAPAFFIGLFIAILVKIVTYISTQAKETFK